MGGEALVQTARKGSPVSRLPAPCILVLLAALAALAAGCGGAGAPSVAPSAT